MFNFFKKRRKEREEQARLLKEQRQEKERQAKQALKERYLARKAYIDSWVETFDKEERAKELAQINETEKNNRQSNRTCPNCKSTDVHQAYARLKGEVNGELRSASHSSSSFGLFHNYNSHSSYANGSLHGEMDTIRVNKCNQCNHEWERKSECLISVDWYPGKVDLKRDVPRFLERIVEIYDKVGNFDPTDLTETAETVEEYIQECINQIKWRFDSKVFDLPLEILFYYGRRYHYYIDNDEERLFGEDVFKGDYQVDCYIKTFHPDIENFLINVFGFKKHFNDE